MGFLTSLFGGETNIWTIGFALIIVIVLIVAGVWLLKMLFNVSGSMGRGRQRRLALIDTMALDNRHNLVIVRHDDTEHLLVLSNSGATLVQADISTQDENVIPKISSSQDISPSDKPSTERTNTNKSATIAAGAAGAAIVAGAATSTSAPTTSPQEPATPQKRSGLLRFLQRKPKAQKQAPLPKVETSTASAPKIDTVINKPVEQQAETPNKSNLVTQLHPSNTNSELKSGPSLRHTGLLVPVSEMVSVPRGDENSANIDINSPPKADSVMNEAQQIDSKAMESIEEGAVPGNESSKEKRSKGKSKPAKKSS